MYPDLDLGYLLHRAFDANPYSLFRCRVKTFKYLLLLKQNQRSLVGSVCSPIASSVLALLKFHTSLEGTVLFRVTLLLKFAIWQLATNCVVDTANNFPDVCFSIDGLQRDSVLIVSQHIFSFTNKSHFSLLGMLCSRAYQAATMNSLLVAD